MIQMKKNTILYILIVFLALANAFFLTKHLSHPRGKKMKNPGDFVAEQLKFDDGQMEKFKVLNDKHIKDMETISKDIKTLKGSLFTKISEEGISKKTVDSLTSMIGHYEAQRDAKTYYHFRAVQELCTDEQKERFNEIVKKALRKTGRQKRHRDRS